MRTLADLISDDPAWPLVQEWIAAAKNHVEVLPANRQAGEAALLATQVTTRSPMGAVAYETGGLLIDYGWLRFLGAGSPGRMERTLPGWNRLDDGQPRLQGGFLVADDAAGGFFALNGGAFDGKPGDVFYLAPDTLEWEPFPLGGYSELLLWACAGDLAGYYRSLRWDDWQEDIRDLSGDRVLGTWPPLWSKESETGPVSRRPIPAAEIWGLTQDFRRQLPRGAGG